MIDIFCSYNKYSIIIVTISSTGLCVIDLSDLSSVHFGSARQNVLKYDLKKVPHLSHLGPLSDIPDQYLLQSKNIISCLAGDTWANSHIFVLTIVQGVHGVQPRYTRVSQLLNQSYEEEASSHNHLVHRKLHVRVNLGSVIGQYPWSVFVVSNLSFHHVQPCSK